MAHGAVTLLVLKLLSVDSFVPSSFYRSSVGRSAFYYYKESPQDEDGEGEIFYNDFDDFVGEQQSDAANPSMSSSLNERCRSLQEDARVRQDQIQQNWDNGNWKVRGFQLDSQNAHDIYDEKSGKIVVTSIHSNEDEKLVWLGRSDGSLLSIELGEAYLTKFESKLEATEGDDSVRISSRLVRQKQEDSPPAMIDEDGEPVEMNPDDLEFMNRRPFRIVHHMAEPKASTASASSETSPAAVEHLLYLPEHELLWTATADGKLAKYILEDTLSGVRHPISVPGSSEPSPLPVVSLLRVNEQVVCTVTTESLYLWDAASGQLLYRCNCCFSTEPGGGEDVVVTSASADADNIYIGTDLGTVRVYAVADLLDRASEGDDEVCPLPAGQWQAFEAAVTCLASGGPGVLGRENAPSTGLWCGSHDGTVKRYEVIAAGDHLQSWPRMSSQRLSNELAHLFTGHEAAITQFIPRRNTGTESDNGDDSLVSASMDGSVHFWDTKRGTTRFTLEGLEGLMACLGSVLLAPTGNYVCLHDFDVDPMGEGDFEIEADGY